MAAQLIQEDLTLTRTVGQTASFSCRGTAPCADSDIDWYQKKETFRMILRFTRDNGNIDTGYGHPQIADFSVENKQNGCELKIEKVKLQHSATYYCLCGKEDLHSDAFCLQPVQKPPDQQTVFVT